MIQLPPLPPNSLEGQVVLVTGAYGGLGEAVCRAVAEAGATVVLLGKKVPKLNRVYDALKKIGPEPAMYPLDMRGADPADYEAMADKIAAELGGLNGIVHCAADFSGLRPLETTDAEEFITQIHVNLTAPWLLTQACLPVLHLGLDWYQGWRSIVVYPGEFLVPRSVTDDAGVVHEYTEPFAREAWDGGPVLISWEDAQRASTIRQTTASASTSFWIATMSRFSTGVRTSAQNTGRSTGCSVDSVQSSQRSMPARAFGCEG